MFLVFAAYGAQDWSTSVGISVKHAGKRDRLQFHHVFPKAYLRKHRPDLSQSQIDDVANLAFIGGSTNRAISAKAPLDYLAALAKTKPGFLRAQQIPTDERLFEAERYLDFIAARRDLIATRLTTFHGAAQ